MLYFAYGSNLHHFQMKRRCKDSIFLKKGDEVGRFMLGSTVVVCFGKNKVDWLNKITANSIVKMGQCVGRF